MSRVSCHRTSGMNGHYLAAYLFIVSSYLVVPCQLTVPAPWVHDIATDPYGGKFMVIENVVITNLKFEYGTYGTSIPNLLSTFRVDVSLDVLTPSTETDNQTCHSDTITARLKNALGSSQDGGVYIALAIAHASDGQPDYIYWNIVNNALLAIRLHLNPADSQGQVRHVVELPLKPSDEFKADSNHNVGPTFGSLEFATPCTCSESTPVYSVRIGTTSGARISADTAALGNSTRKSGHCPHEVDAHGIHWRSAYQNTRVSLSNSCPADYNGTVYRHCSANAVWQASVLNCTAVALTAIQDEIKAGSVNASWSLTELASFLGDPNATSHELLVGDVLTATGILADIVTILDATNDTIEDEEILDFLNVAGTLMDKNVTSSWKSILQESGAGIDQLLNDTERFFDLVATARNQSTDVTEYEASNLYVQSGRITELGVDVVFPNRTAPGISPWASTSVDGMVLPVSPEMLGSSYTGILYEDLRGMLSQQFRTSDPATFLNSPVISMTLTPRLGTSLSTPATLTFHLFKTSSLQPHCSFWTPSSTGGWWDTEGCTLDSYSVEDLTVVCKCTHLTNFAILMSPVPASRDHSKVLGIISMVGCITSMLCLALTFTIYMSHWRQVRSGRAILLMNLCICLFLAYFGFLLGVDKVAHKTVCTAVAAILHFLYLTVFFIMLAKSLYLAKMLLLPMNRTPIAKWCLLAAYGCAAVVVGVSLGVTKLHGYGTHTTCWLSIHSGLLWAFVGPALVVMLVNAVIVVVVLKVKFSTVYMVKKRTREKISSGLRNIVVLLPVMGLTWVLGVFSVSSDTVVFQYLFAVTNSLQGFLIFVFHCLLDHKVNLAINRSMRKTLRKARPLGLYANNTSTDTNGTQDSDLAPATTPTSPQSRNLRRLAYPTTIK